MGRRSHYSAGKRRRELAKKEKREKKLERKEERKRQAELEALGLWPPPEAENDDQGADVAPSAEGAEASDGVEVTEPEDQPRELKAEADA